MFRQLLKSKIHRATVTESNRDYEGSITIDEALLEASNILPWEKVLIANVDTGQRVETYAISGPKNSGIICMNGGASFYARKGEAIIIMSFALMAEEEIPNHKPIVIRVDRNNQITSREAEKCAL
ncbi:MAG: aspartate 1-decarboxylase [Candidatus Omnitrophica bacterium]|nr:aspartate 1-decarboxylase [Candidatus Omnitrophota bacterium]